MSERTRATISSHASVLLAAAASAALAGCGAAPHSRAAGAVAPLTVRPVAWNATNAAVGHVRAVAEDGDVVCVFADDGVTVLSSRAVVSRDASVKGWVAGGTVAAADGASRWIIGIDAEGHVRRLRGMTAFEDVSARWALDGRRVLGSAVLGAGQNAFLLDREIAFSDGAHVTRYGSSPFTELAGGGGFGAGVTADGLEVINATNRIVTRFALPGVTHAALDPHGRLYATTKRAVYASDAGGGLQLVYVADGDTVRGVVASGDRVWFADDGELGTLDGDRVAETSGLRVPKDATLAPSPNGDVWVLGGGGLSRYELGANVGPPSGPASGTSGPAAPGPAPSATGPTWSQTIAPVFARACGACHQPNGASGIDLSNADAWQTKRTLIRERVLTTRTMPPQGHALSDADREAIRAWVDKGH